MSVSVSDFMSAGSSTGSGTMTNADVFWDSDPAQEIFSSSMTWGASAGSPTTDPGSTYGVQRKL